MVLYWTLRAIRSDIAVFQADMIEVRERIGLLVGTAAPLPRRVDRIGGDIF